MSYGKTFTRNDYIYKNFSILDCFHDSTRKPYDDKSWNILGFHTIFERVLSNATTSSDKNNIIKHNDMLKVLVYNLTEEEVLRDNEVRITDVLDTTDIEKETIYNRIPLAWGLVENTSLGDDEVITIYMIDSLLPRHNMARLLIDKLEDEQSRSCIPHNPLQSAHGYWKKWFEEEFQDKDGLHYFTNGNITEFLEKFEWEDFYEQLD
jgi:hypothetical protein